MKRISLILSILSLIAVVWLVLQLEKRAKCLHSDSIERVVLMNSEQSPKILHEFSICGNEAQASPKRPELEVLNAELRSALFIFDRLMIATHKPKKIAAIRIVRQPEMQFSIEPNLLTLSASIAESQGQVLKGLIGSWLLQVNKDLLYKKLFLEVLSDFYFATVNGGVTIANPINDQVAEFNHLTKVVDFQWTQKQLCESGWVPTHHLSLCRSLSKIGDDLKDESERMEFWSPFALRPLYGNLLWKTYMGLSLPQRVLVLRRMTENLERGLPTFQEWEGFQKSDIEEKREAMSKDLMALVGFLGKKPEYRARMLQLFDGVYHQ